MKFLAIDPQQRKTEHLEQLIGSIEDLAQEQGLPRVILPVYLRLLAGLQHSVEVRLPGGSHDGADAERQARGLRGPRGPRPRRLALTLSLRLLLAAGLVLVAAGPALAHSLLLESSPAAGATLASAPDTLMLRFNNRIEKPLSRIRLVDAAGVQRPLDPVGRRRRR